MTEARSKQGRTRDARLAREVILDAAEAVFSEHGFDGARIDAIAKASGYNISLLFQYFGDKLGLYTEVLKRTDRDLQVLQTRILNPLLEYDQDTISAQEIRTFFITVVRMLFDYLLEHPRFLRILTWEMAEGWQTYRQIISHLQNEDQEQFERFLQMAEQAGLLRSSFTPFLQLTMIAPICQSYMASLPLYQALFPQEDLVSENALSRAREHLVTFIVSGMLVDAPEPDL